MWLLLAFLLVPLIEIALFIQVGGLIGLFPTLGLVVLTAVIGSLMVRSQGANALMRMRRSFETLEDPTTPLADGAMILFAGALLLTPGFFTDAFGFALLIPQSRAVILSFIRSRIEVARFSMGQPREPKSNGQTIDGDYEDVTPEFRRNDRSSPSGWTRH